MGLNKKLGSSLLFQFINLFATGILAIIAVPFLLRSYGDIAFGVFQIIVSFNIIKVLLEFGMGGAILKYTSNYYRQGISALNRFVSTFIAVKSVLSLIGMIIAIFIGHNFYRIFSDVPANLATDIIRSCYIFSFGLLLSNVLAVWNTVLRGIVRFDLANISDLFARTTFFVLILVLIFVKPQPTISDLTFLQFVYIPVATACLDAFFLKRHLKGFRLIPSQPSWNIIKKTWRYMGGMTIIALTSQFFAQGTRGIIGIITNPVSVTMYSIALKVKNPILQLNNAIMRPLIPGFSESEIETEQSQLKKAILFQKYESIFFMGIISLTFILCYDFILLWVGPDYIDSVVILQVLLAPYLLPRTGSLLMYYYATGRTRISMINNLLYTTMALGLSLPLAYFYGVIGFVAGVSLSLAITQFIYLFSFRREYKFNLMDYAKRAYSGSYLIVIVLFAAYFGYLALPFEADTWPVFIALTAFFGLLYFVLIIMVIGKSDRKVIRQYIRKLQQKKWHLHNTNK
ncbi:MAG: oligosaccharide flippase family protein [Bacteroidales bacterium]|nr:oligosaccharide flippase family protein [Bacteroidales bacterium]